MVIENNGTFSHGGDWVTYEELYGRDVLDFSANVSPLGLPASVKEAVCASLETANRYPDPECRKLRTAIADKYSLDGTTIMCGNGAADLIYRLAYAVRPKKALVLAPDFMEYENALTKAGCEIVYWEWMQRSVRIAESLCLPEELGWDGLPARMGKVRIAESPYRPEELLMSDVEMVILSNPNNPSGLLHPSRFLRELAEQCEKRNILLVVDECFMDFVECSDCHTLLHLTRRYKHLCVLRAFTKFYGMAGLRLGWCATSDSRLICKMREAGPPWQVSTPAQAAGIAALKDVEYKERLRKLVAGERGYLQEELRKLGIFVMPGEANYVFFHTNTVDFADRLIRRGVAIRNCSNYRGLDVGWYRVAVRLREENETFTEAVRQILT